VAAGPEGGGVRKSVPETLESGRVRQGPFGSDSSYGFNGAFFVLGPCGKELKIIASDGMGWEHVSVSLRNRCPNWQEMCFVKGLFWDEEEAVMQLHPPKSDYVNYHPYCLHLWRPLDAVIPLPPSSMVGPKSSGEAA
jgi:hypothetical protein